eukprot:gb/GFBE01042637.1/.p1 GENE.gb/GFBE01042637.1/~~gb/GFBE01042637.1/.p1  ORF type:complete len:399 (+),score=98.90 gb/GFBE01042637.1/:1-1197(+)
MGSYLSEPKKDKNSDSGRGNGLTWGSSDMQGWRTSMEDAHVTLTDLGEQLKGTAMFAVFDGHGGKEVAKFCERHMPSELLSICEQTSDPGTLLTNGFHRMDDMLRAPEYLEELQELKGGAARVDPSSSSIDDPAVGSEDRAAARSSVIENSIKQDLIEAKARGAISREDAQQMMMKMMLLKRLDAAGNDDAVVPEPAMQVGCTAVCTLLTKSHLICANAGDSRAVLCRKGKAVALSQDHKPNCPTERSRIEAAGGTVQAAKRGAMVTYRVNGNLSLSRAIGDLQYKGRSDLPPERQIVCATPDVHREALSPDDEFVVLACDGIWDVKSSQEVCNFVRRRLMRRMPIVQIVEQLMEACCTTDPKKTMGIGADNMTCIVVQFDHWKMEDAVDSSCVCAIS